MDFLLFPENFALLASFADVVRALLYVVFVFSAILLILVILLQEGKGGGFGDVFGGAGSEAFGPRVGGVNKFTASIAGFFLVSLIGIHLVNRPPSIETQEAPESTVPEDETASNPDASPFDVDRARGPGNATAQAGERLSPEEIAAKSLGAFGAVEGGAENGAPSTQSQPSWDDRSWGLSEAQRSFVTEPPPAPVKSDDDAGATEEGKAGGDSEKDG